MVRTYSTQRRKSTNANVSRKYALNALFVPPASVPDGVFDSTTAPAGNLTQAKHTQT
jgi:hypothetical protein